MCDSACLAARPRAAVPWTRADRLASGISNSSSSQNVWIGCDQSRGAPSYQQSAAYLTTTLPCMPAPWWETQ